VRSRGTFTDRSQAYEDASGETKRTIVDEGFVRQVARLVLEYPDATLVMYAQDAELPTLELFERELTARLRALEPKHKAVRIIEMPATSDKYMRAQRYAATWNEAWRLALSDDAEARARTPAHRSSLCRRRAA
jgi:hypothetical protein